MKRRILLINVLMSFTVLFSMLFQTVDSYEHIFKQISEKRCEHKYTPHQKQITHSHAAEHNCNVCHFAFSTFVPNNSQALFFNKISKEASFVFFYTKTYSTFFKGSLFALRAPPALV